MAKMWVQYCNPGVKCEPQGTKMQHLDNFLNVKIKKKNNDEKKASNCQNLKYTICISLLKFIDIYSTAP